MGGIAVAAAGGDRTAVQNGFLNAGGMVVFQSGQSYLTKNYVDPAVAKADTFCVSAIGAKCSIELPKLQKDGAGKYLLDKSGNPAFDYTGVLLGREDLGNWGAPMKGAGEEASFVESIAPNTNFTADKEWALSWDKSAFTDKSSRKPAVVLTYTGEGSLFDEEMQNMESLSNPSKKAVALAERSNKEVSS